MSSDAEIRLQGVGKTFGIFSSPAGRLLSRISSRARGGSFTALSGVDLNVSKGHCVGIVGRNGAGKSTLLQIVCGIMSPTSGEVSVRGRIAAMLQLGAGFHGEFTGRQNVRLSAAIYGLDAATIDDRMASIEEFAGIGEKIDRPVREYSSGMFARLAFAVCAHVDAEILVVDEILGVGDAAFQQRSMRFLRRFRRNGIVLFVSHDEHAIAALCNRAVWIEGGRVAAYGLAKPVLRRYRQEMARIVEQSSSPSAAQRDLIAVERFSQEEPSIGNRKADLDPDDLPALGGGATIRSVSCCGREQGPHVYAGGEVLQIAVSARATRACSRVAILALLRNPMGQVVLELDSRRLPEGVTGTCANGDVIRCGFEFRLPYLPTGEYPLDVLVLSASDAQLAVEVVKEGALSLRLLSSHVSGGLANMVMETVEFAPVAAGGLS